MKIIELNPKYGETDGVQTHIIFDCPVCKEHRVSIPFRGAKKWDKTGVDFESTTLSPSIAHDNGRGCKGHYFIQNGEIKIV